MQIKTKATMRISANNNNKVHLVATFFFNHPPPPKGNSSLPIISFLTCFSCLFSEKQVRILYPPVIVAGLV